jgi:hypothetical protein
MFKIYPVDVQPDGSAKCYSPSPVSKGSTVEVEYTGKVGEALIASSEPIDRGVLGYHVYLDVNWTSFNALME